MVKATGERLASHMLDRRHRDALILLRAMLDDDLAAGGGVERGPART